jgi:serine/threonine protein kinase, bacterial
MLLSNRYKIIKKIGVGGCGEVFLAEDMHLPSKPKCVVKQFKPSTTNPDDYQLVKDKFELEAKILETLGHHDQIPQLFAHFEENGELYIVEQYIEGLTLKQKVNQDGVFDENFVRDFLVCILPVISFIHSHNIIHRDIKPDNIILRKEDGMPILIDFGVVKDLEETIVNKQYSQTIVTSKGYSAPEQATGFPVLGSDLYSLGMTSIFMLTGKNPTNFFDLSLRKIVLPERLVGSVFLRQTIETAIFDDRKQRFSEAEQMKESIYYGVYEDEFVPNANMYTLYMWKAKYRIFKDLRERFFQNDIKFKFSYSRLYIVAIASCSPNSDEHLRYCQWKIIDERPLLKIKDCIDMLNSLKIS